MIWWNKILFRLILILFSIIPFLNFISIRMPIAYFGEKTLIGSLREIIILIFLFMIVLSYLRNLNLKITYIDIFIIIYICFGFLHIFIGKADLLFAIDDFRLIYLYPIAFIAFNIYNNTFYNQKLLKTIYFKNIFLAQTIVIVLVGLAELIYGNDLRIVLYGDKISSMHINLFGYKGLRIASLLYNPINLGLFLNFGLVLILFSYNKKNNILVIAFALLLETLIIFTFSRIAILISIIIFLLYLYYNKITIKTIVSIIIIICFCVMFINGDYIENKDLVFRRFDQITIENIIKNERVERWNNYLKVVNKEEVIGLLWGIGLGTSNPNEKYFSQYEFIKPVESTYISILGQTGIIGLAMYLIILLYYLIKTLKIIRHNKQKGFVFLGFLIIFLLGNLTTDMYRNNPFSFYFWLLLYIVGKD